MARYYVAGIPFDDENCLKHYGVKGMKWDQHLFGPDANTKYVNWMNDIGKFANKAAKGVGTAVTNAAKTVGSAVNKGANFVTGNQAKQNLNAAKNANPADPNYQAKVNRYQGQYNQTLPGMAGQAAQNATNWVNQAGDNVRNGNVANAVGNAANQAREGVGGFFDRIGDWGRGAINDVGSAVTNAGNAVGDWVNQAGDNVRNGNVANAVSGAVTNAGNAVGDWVNQAGDNVRNGNVANAVSGAVTNAGNAVGDAAKNAGKAISGAADNARKSASGFINSAGQWVSNAANNVGSAVSNATQDAKDFMDYRVTGAGYDKLDPSNPEVQEAFKDVSKSHPSQLSVDSNMTGFSMDPRMVYSPQEAMQYAKEAADMGRNSSLFGRVGNAANSVGDWAGQVARNVGGAVTNAGNAVGDWARGTAGDVGNFVDSNITGNTQRRNAEMYNRTAQNPNADSVARAMNQIAANNAQANAEATLFGRVGNAANSVGDWAGQVARNVGGAVTNAGNAVGDWVNQAARDVGSAASKVANGVSNWYTGQPGTDRAESIDRQVQNYERLGDMAYDQGMGARGDEYHRLAAALGSIADTNQAQYDNAPRQRLNSAVQDAAGWFNQAGDNVRNWIDDRFLNHSALDDKPEGVTDTFWSNYVASGGTREQYERDWK